MLVSMVSSSKKKSQSVKGKLFPKLDDLYFTSDAYFQIILISMKNILLSGILKKY